MKLVNYIEDERDQIFVEIFNNFVSLSQNVNGVNVIKSMITVLKGSQSQKLIIDKILEGHIKFMEDKYSNYAFQHIIANWDFSVTKPLFEAVKTNVSYLSAQKCASNSIESVFLRAPIEFLDAYIREIKADVISTCLIRLIEQLLWAFRVI
jgi:hypothetical protein